MLRVFALFLRQMLKQCFKSSHDHFFPYSFQFVSQYNLTIPVGTAHNILSHKVSLRQSIISTHTLLVGLHDDDIYVAYRESTASKVQRNKVLSLVPSTGRYITTDTHRRPIQYVEHDQWPTIRTDMLQTSLSDEVLHDKTQKSTVFTCPFFLL
jgi:hypothetical protein